MSLLSQAPAQYDAVMNMEYLDAALNESLRLYPVGNRLERFCKKTVEIGGLTIPKGTVVVVPTFPLHRDPEYWPEPDTFNPERYEAKEDETESDALLRYPIR